MAPRARSMPAVSTAMASALDPLSAVLVSEHPGGEARGLDRMIRLEHRPIHGAPRLRRPAAAPLGLSHHLPGARDPGLELGPPQLDPTTRRLLPRTPAASRHDPHA